MDQRTITREISNDDLQAALELFYRSLGIVKKDEEVVEASFTKGPILITFTIQQISQGVESISFK